MNRLAVLLATSALLAPTAAFAWPVHGLHVQSISETMGADTPVGLGSISYGDLGYTGAAGTLSITSQTDASGAVTTWSFNLASKLWACVGHTVDAICVANTYGGTKPAWNGPYTLTLSGTNYSATLIISILAGKAYFTTNCDATSTPPTCSDAAGHPDSATTSELRTLVANRNAYAGDETLVGRNTPTFGLQYSPFGVQFKLTPPAGPYPGFLWITSEHASAALCPGQVMQACGGFRMGQTNWDVSTSGDVDQRAGTTFIEHYSDYQVTGTLPLFEKSSVSAGFGFIVDHDDFSFGPDVFDAYLKNGFSWFYRPTSTSPCDPDHPGGNGVACAVATVRDSTFNNTETPIQITSTLGTVGPTAGAIVLRNTLFGPMRDAMDVMPGGRTDVEYNLIAFPNSCCGRHSDSMQVEVSSSQNGVVNQSAGIYAYNFAVRGQANLGATVAAVGSVVGGAGYASDGTFLQVLFSGGHGLRATSTVTVSGGVVTSVVPTAGGAQGSDSGGGYQVGDVLTPIIGTGPVPMPGGCSPCATATVTSVTGRGDFQGTPFYHQTGTDHWTGVSIHNNFNLVVQGNGPTFDATDNASLTYNLVLYDAQAYRPANATTATVIQVGANLGGVGASFDYTTSNAFASGIQSGTITCAPGLITSAPKCSPTNVLAANLAAYQTIIPGWTDVLTSRTAIIAMLGSITSTVFTAHPEWPVTPYDVNGAVCWNASGVVYNAAQTCVQMGTAVAQ